MAPSTDLTDAVRTPLIRTDAALAAAHRPATLVLDPSAATVIDVTSSTDLTDAVRARLTETGVALAAAHSAAAHLLDTLSRRR